MVAHCCEEVMEVVRVDVPSTRLLGVYKLLGVYRIRSLTGCLRYTGDANSWRGDVEFRTRSDVTLELQVRRWQ